MTISDAKSLLFNFFAQNDLINLETNFDEVVEFSEVGDVDRKIIEAALSDFEKGEIVRRIDDNCWVLTKPLIQYSQNFEIGGQTVLAITNVINEFCAKMKNKDALVDPLNVSEKNIQDLTVLASTYVDNIKSE
jgi:hypothetical protein